MVDVEGFGDERRANWHQVAVRDGLYRAMQKAFDQAGIPWADCDHEDRGDGVFVLVPPDVPKELLAESLPPRWSPSWIGITAPIKLQSRYG